jgi:hypothetical protein
MKPINLDLFAVPISVINLGEQSRLFNQNVLMQIDQIRKDEQSQLRTGVGVWQSSPNLEKRYPWINVSLPEYFFSLSLDYIKKAGLTGDISSYMKCEDFWINYNESPYAYHAPHIHGKGDTMFSGVYYPSSGILNGEHISEKQNLNAPVEIISSGQPKPGSLVLLDPASAIKSQVHPGEKLNRYPYYGLEICITPREGVLVLFPHYLQHLVTPTETPGFIRTSVAFNINIKR